SGTTGFSPTPSTMRSPSSTCCRSATTRLFTARVPSLARCPETTGRSLPGSVPSLHTSGPTQANSSCLWDPSLPNARNGKKPGHSIGRLPTTPPTAASNDSLLTSTTCTNPGPHCGNSISLTRVSPGLSTGTRTTTPSAL